MTFINIIEERDAAISKGKEQRDKRNYQKAITYYTRAIELDPNYANAYSCRSSVYYIVGQYDNALADISRVIKLNPVDAFAYVDRGDIQYELKQYGKALADYTKAIELEPNEVIPYFSRGNVYRSLKQYDEAIADDNKAIELDPDCGDAYLSRGDVYYELKQYDSAVADYLKAMELGSKDPDLMKSYKKALTALNNQKQATSVAQPVVQQSQPAPAHTNKAELVPQERRKLRQYLTTRFSLPELHALAFDLDIDYQSFPHDTIDEFALEFIGHCQRVEQLPTLIKLALELRPDPDIEQLLRQ